MSIGKVKPSASIEAEPVSTNFCAMPARPEPKSPLPATMVGDSVSEPRKLGESVAKNRVLPEISLDT
tara:strand:+ start:1485 stop:1685 length:201 start_codon:yes stop_codon:yes gene_type:complete